MFTPYQPRPLSFIGIETIAGFRLKVYTIHYDGESFDRQRFAAGEKLAESQLPRPAVNEKRLGVGFMIMHQGRTGDYLIVSWWDNENELPTRIFVRDQSGWRVATGSESFCVWDLRVIWKEREAYVRNVLAGRADGLASYLAAIVQGDT